MRFLYQGPGGEGDGLGEGDSFVLADADGNFATVPTSVIQDMITKSSSALQDSLQQFVTTQLKPYAKSTDLNNYVKIGNKVRIRDSGGWCRTLIRNENGEVSAGHGNPNTKEKCPIDSKHTGTWEIVNA